MIILENDLLKVVICSKGAELSSILDKRDNTEHIWYGKPDIWPWHAPNLFPVVGGCLDNKLHVDGKEFNISRHGFARQSQFVKLEAKPDYASLSLHWGKETYPHYPYKFEFQVLYQLSDKKLRITYKVINRDEKDIFFSVGAHPAFNVPFFSGENYDDYYLEFENEEPLRTHLLSADGFFTGETETVHTIGNKLYLSPELFERDALVFKDISSRRISIKSFEHDKNIVVTFPNFNYLGLWAKPGAPFVCIEPWLGCADSESRITDISQKEGIQKLEHGHVSESDFYIEIN